jgi:hypothetical protein
LWRLWPDWQGRKEHAKWRKREPAMRKFASFSQFYAFYLGEHTKRTTRRLHFFGSAVGLICLVLLGVTRNPWWLAAALFAGYGLAWFSHFVFEKNRPATFRQPLYSFMGDCKMFWQILTGQIGF